MAQAKPKKLLAEDIYSSLKEEILNVTIPPGTVLEESDIMRRFGVSRTPVREAIRSLISVDLVGMEPHRSAYVKHLTLDDISGFFEAYQLTQRLVFVLSADRITKKQLETLAEIEKKITNAFAKQDISTIRKLNDRFYGTVASGCFNRFLEESHKKLREYGSRLSAIVHYANIGNDWEMHASTLLRDHEQIISALSIKDCEAIGEISNQDVALFREKVFQALERPLPPSIRIDAPIASRK